MKNIATFPKDDLLKAVEAVQSKKRTGEMILSFSRGNLSGTIRWLEKPGHSPLDLRSLLMDPRESFCP